MWLRPSSFISEPSDAFVNWEEWTRGGGFRKMVMGCWVGGLQPQSCTWLCFACWASSGDFIWIKGFTDWKSVKTVRSCPALPFCNTMTLSLLCCVITFFQPFILKWLYIHRKVPKKCVEWSHILSTQFPLVITSCITIVQCQNQEISTDTSSEFIQIVPVLNALMHVCLISCSFITCVDLCNHHSQDTKLFNHHKTPSCYPFIATLALVIAF